MSAKKKAIDTECNWAPKGKGWHEYKNENKDKPWKRQWIFTKGKDKAVIRDYGDYREQIIGGNRIYSGKGGGSFLISDSGEIEIHWRIAAAFSASHGAGNRKNKITKATGKRNPAEFDEILSQVDQIRNCFILSTAKDPIPGLPNNGMSKEAGKLLQVFQKEAFELFAAMIRGDYQLLQRIAKAVENHETIIRQPMTNERMFQEIGNALEQAIHEVDGVPIRKQVTWFLAKGRGAIRGANSQGVDERFRDYVRDCLSKMGFGWIPAPSGKRGKKRGPKLA